MWKKVLISFLICSALLAIGTTSHATREAVDTSKYQLTSPEQRSYTSRDRIALINGKAPSGTIITIEVYGTTDLTRKVFNLHKLPTKDDYIEIHEEDIEVGNMGFFDRQLELVTGINKIVIGFNVKGVPSQEIIILVEPKVSRQNREVKLTDIMTLIR